MIVLTHLDGREFVLNVDLIESFESTPETVITLTLNKRVIVKETVSEVLSKVVRYRQTIFRQYSGENVATFFQKEANTLLATSPEHSPGEAAQTVT